MKAGCTTFSAPESMSAPHLLADIRPTRGHVGYGSLADMPSPSRHVRFTLEKRTSEPAASTSAKGQKRTSSGFRIMSA
jgi:hypothetical protein